MFVIFIGLATLLTFFLPIETKDKDLRVTISNVTKGYEQLPN